jgi:hypothetical protein
MTGVKTNDPKACAIVLPLLQRAGFNAGPARSARQFVFPQEFFDAARYLFSMRLEGKMTRVK